MPIDSPNWMKGIFSKPDTSLRESKLFEDAIKATAKQLAQYGITEEMVRNHLGAQNTQVPGLAGLSELTSLPITTAMEKYASSAEGSGGGGSSSFSLGVDPAQEFNQTMEFNRESSIADFIGNIISQEVQRKGLALSTGSDLIKQYQDAMASAMPSNLKVVPGFENNGMVSKMGKMMGVDTSGIMNSAQNPEFGNLPFSTLSQNLNEYQNMTPESQIEKYRPLIEQMFKEQQPLETIQTSGSGSWDSSGGMGYEQPVESGVSPDVATTLMDAMQSRISNQISKVGDMFRATAKPKTTIGDQSMLHAGTFQYTKAEKQAALDRWKLNKAAGSPSQKWIETFVKNLRIRRQKALKNQEAYVKNG